MQIAWQLDPKTVGKLKKSLLIGTSGFLVGLVAILMADPVVLAWLTAHPIVALGASSYLPVLLNGINEWRTGQGVDTINPQDLNK